MANLRDFTGKNRKFTGTIGERISVGTTAERDTATFGAGTLRYNSNNNLLEYYDNTAWREVRDLNNVITTQGDVLYRDGSGLARLAAGTSGEFLKTNGAGANPSWAGIDPAAIVKVGFAENSTRYTPGDSSDTALFTVTFAKSLSATLSKVHVVGQVVGRGSYSDWCGVYFDCLTGGMTTHNTNDSAAFKGISMANAPSGSRAGECTINKVFEDTSNFTAATHTFEFGWKVRNGDSGNKPFTTVNTNSSDDARAHAQSSTFTFFEVLR